MHILLRNGRTALYLNQSAEWTADPRLARAFEHGAEAVHMAYKLHVDCPELVMQFDDPSHTFAVMLSDEGAPRGATLAKQRTPTKTGNNR